jgi:hypothetical protein
VTAALAVLGTVAATAVPAVASAAAPPSDVQRVQHANLHPYAQGPHNPRLKQVLSRGEDDAPEAPSITAKCQKYVGKPNPYKPTGSNVDMIVGDNIVSVGSQAGCYTAQNENTIAVNPNNPNNIVSGTNDYRVYNARENRNDSSGWAYTSMDGGKTWTNVLLPALTYQTDAQGPLKAMDSAGDPVLSFGPNNTVYYGNIVFSRGAPADGGTEAPNGIVLSISHDGGLTFGKPKIIELDGVDQHGTPTASHVFNDKIWLAADPNSNNVYVTWTRFLDTADGGYAESPIVISTSSNGGKTFSQYSRIDTQAGVNNPGLQPYSQGSNPQVGPDGTLYVAYESEYCQTGACDKPTDHDVTVVATSTDHGQSFARSIVGTNYDFPFNGEVGDSTLTRENFRINSFPQLAVDPVTGQAIVTWNDDRNGSYDGSGNSIKTNGDNIASSSTDGIRWTKPVAIGSAEDEVFGAVASYNGTAAITSYTRNYQAGGIKLDFAYWPITAAPGQQVQAGSITRITTQSSDPRVQFVGVGADGAIIQGTFIGDYTGTVLGADLRLHPAWTDFRGNPGVTTPNQDAYTKSIDLSGSSS